MNVHTMIVFRYYVSYVKHEHMPSSRRHIIARDLVSRTSPYRTLPLYVTLHLTLAESLITSME